MQMGYGEGLGLIERQWERLVKWLVLEKLNKNFGS